MTTSLFHSLTFADPDAAITWLTAVGFTDRGVHRDDTGAVVHAQFDWDDRGAIMFGARRGDRADSDNSDGVNDKSGVAKCYAVVANDADVDAVYQRALDAGSESIQAPMDPDYGGRTCTVKDLEGNQWSFGSYPGE